VPTFEVTLLTPCGSSKAVHLQRLATVADMLAAGGFGGGSGVDSVKFRAVRNGVTLKPTRMVASYGIEERATVGVEIDRPPAAPLVLSQ
jgi:hypothetical protein